MRTGPRQTTARSKAIIPTFVQMGACAILLLIGPGCRCPWTCTNTDLAQSTHWLQNGIDALNAGEHAGAEDLIQQAVTVRPEDPVLREHLADALIKQGKTQEAIDQLSRAVELSGNDARLYVKLGSLYLDNGQWIPAARFAEIALKNNRQLPEAWALQGDTHFAKGQLSDALADYQRALSYENALPEVQLKVAEVHRLLGRPMRAFSTVEQMLTQAPTAEHRQAALLVAGQLLIEVGQPAQAVEKLQLAASDPSASENCFIYLADAYLAMQQPSQARLTLVKAQELHPSSTRIATRLDSLQQDNRRIAAVARPQDEVTR